MSELWPCRCGETVIRCFQVFGRNHEVWRVDCNKCNIGVERGKKESAIKVWNNWSVESQRSIRAVIYMLEQVQDEIKRLRSTRDPINNIEYYLEQSLSVLEAHVKKPVDPGVEKR